MHCTMITILQLDKCKYKISQTWITPRIIHNSRCDLHFVINFCEESFLVFGDFGGWNVPIETWATDVLLSLNIYVDYIWFIFKDTCHANRNNINYMTQFRLADIEYLSIAKAYLLWNEKTCDTETWNIAQVSVYIFFTL